ncbi:MAG: gliding motility protein GldM [Sphingobacteriales bacterium]|nr:MAG: gliding motility protein GldM [Sphingobacteriales bacterium]
MAGANETPRQKMMGILYLVLLGLVATNVSTSVLDAFRRLTESLVTSSKNVQSSIDNTFKSFEATKLKDEPERARLVYDKAVKARKLCDDLDKKIEDHKKAMVDEGGGFSEEINDIKGRDNQDAAYRLMINQKRGPELKAQIEKTKAELLALLDPKDRATVNLPLDASDPKPRGGIKTSWEMANFGDGVPLTAAYTTLTKIQADLKNAEAEVVKKVLGQMDRAVVNLDQFAAVAVAPSSYVIQGQPYSAEVFLTASDSKSNPEISVNGQSLNVQNGKGVYTLSTSKEGTFAWTGLIKVKQTDGTVKEYRTAEQTYQVARPSAVVSADKMNVLYIGVSNPVSVSAPGIPKEKLKLGISGGSASGANGNYNISVSSPGKAMITVSAETAPGKTQTLSSTEFRIKRIPDPRVKFAGKTGGKLSTVAFKSQNRLFAALDNFDFDAKFDIQSFSMIIVRPRSAGEATVLKASGTTLNPAMMQAMASLTPGSRVIFDNIIAVGPDKQMRQLDPLTLTAE